MSAHPSRWPVPPLLLGRCGPAWARGVALLLAVPLAAIAALLAARGEPVHAVAPAAFAVGFAWVMWFSRLLLLHVEARQSRVPRLARAVGTSLAGAWLCTVALPALLLARAGADPAFALSALSAAATGGLLVALLPTALYLLLCFVPMLLGLLRALAERGLGPDALPHWAPRPAHLPWLALALAMLAAWRWHACLRDAGTGRDGAWRQPMIASRSSSWGWNAMLDGGAAHWRANLPDWMWPAGQVTRSGPTHPVRAMRSLLGTPFAPLGGRQLLTQFGLLAIVAAYLLVDTGRPRGPADISALAGGLLGGGAVLVLMYGQRLEALRQRRSGELDELALLPGWGEPARARGLLLRAVAWSPAIASAATMALLLFASARAGVAADKLGLLGMAIAGIVLTAALACLRPLAGLRLDGLRLLLVVAPGLLLAMLSVVLVMRAGGGVPAVLVVLWVCAYGALGSALAATWRRFVARPHPFVQD